STPPLFGTQTDHRGSSSSPTAVPAEPEADLTLKELREAVELKCSLPAIHYALEGMGLTYKKRHSEPANKTVRTSRGRAERGADDTSVGIPPDSSSSTSRARRPT